MATIVNDRDVKLQATTPRYSALTFKTLLLTADSTVFKVVSGVGSPTSITLTAKLLGLLTAASWSISGGTLSGSTANVRTLSFANAISNTITVTATVVEAGVTYTSTVTIVKVFDGTNGSNGSSGSNGIRGTVQIVASGSSWSDSTANSAISSATGTSPIDRDIVTITNSSSFSQAKFYSSGSWLTLNAYIGGNMVVSGTLSADTLNGGTIIGSAVNLGSGSFQVTTGGAVTSSNFFGYCSAFGNTISPGTPAVDASGNSFSSIETGRFSGTSSSAGAHGVRGKNTSYGTSGLVGMAGAWDFYADGSGTNYGPFTGAHDALVANGAPLEVGDLVIDLDLVAARNVSNTLFTVERSSEPNQRGVRGVVAVVVGPLQDHCPAALIAGRSETFDADGRSITHDIMHGSFYDLGASHTLVAMNSVGEGMLKVCGEGGPIAPDDLLVASSTPGVAMKQADDIMRGYTVAKARIGKGQTITFDGAEVKLLPCIYLCG